MAQEYGPNIVTDGLVLCLDAADKNSYPGSGTTWYDLSGNGNDGTLTNGPTFSSDKGGTIVFDGANDYVSMPHSATLKPTVHITVSAWVYSSDWSSTTAQRFVSNTESAGMQLSWNEGSYVPSGHIGFLINLTTVAYKSAYFAVSTLGAGWHYIVGTYDGRYVKFYFDGNLVDTEDAGATYTIHQHSSNSTFIGAEAATGATPSGQYFYGRIAGVKIYNRALSAKEISQNFNAQRSRFGI